MSEKGYQRNKNQKEQKENNKMIDLNLNISRITLNYNGLNTPIKKHKCSEYIEKRPKYMLPTSNSLQI